MNSLIKIPVLKLGIKLEMFYPTSGITSLARDIKMILKKTIAFIIKN